MNKKLQWMWENIFPKKHPVQYHVLQKRRFFERDHLTKHEQNEVKSGQNIIPVIGVF